MRTNLPGVYAAGDCAETIDFITGGDVYRPMGSVATYSAEIAGSNIAGVEKGYEGFVREQYDRVFGKNVISMGLTVQEAKCKGIAAESYDMIFDNIMFRTLPTRALMKAIVRRDNGVIIGWQIVGSVQTSWPSLLFREIIYNRQDMHDVGKLGNSTVQNSVRNYFSRFN